MLKKLRTLSKRLLGSLYIFDTLKPVRDALIHESLDRLKREPRHLDSKSLVPHGYKAFSQNEEDGMIREIFDRIGVTNKTFVEFGVGNGLENNTLALLFDGWKGLWIEGSETSAAAIREGFKGVIAQGALILVRSFITRENIDALIAPHASGEIDLLSVDIDGNDFHVFEAITCVNPRVVVMEYNAKFPPPVLYCMPYDAAHVWSGDDCMGASLEFLARGLATRGYRLVGCDLIGSNAFFVREDLAGDRFLEPFTAKRHYEPARYHLSAFAVGHPAGYATLEKFRR